MERWYRGALLLPDRMLADGLVRVGQGRILGVWDLERGPAPAPRSDRVIRVESGFVAPGFVDLHVHGGGGADFMDGDPEGVVAITRMHARFGTTSLMATTLTASENAICQAIKAVARARCDGAQILGIHVEGPFINPVHGGAQESCYIRPPSLDEAERWMAVAPPGVSWQVTIAPEMDGALSLIRQLASRGVVFSAGHTDATFEQLQAAADAGLRYITHLFNGMRGLHHREPGVVGGGLTIPGLSVELIADGVHLHPAVIQLALAAKGWENVILVTDAIRATGMAAGIYRLGEGRIAVAHGESRLPDGKLAGSVLTMVEAVRNVVKWCGIPLYQAVAMASYNPARLHGLQNKKGQIKPGLDADLVILDSRLQVVQTLVGGEVAFHRDA